MDKYELKPAARAMRKQNRKPDERIADTLDDIAEVLEDLLRAFVMSRGRR